MDLSTLERAIRVAMTGGTPQPAFAALASSTELSPELAHAAGTLAARAEREPGQSSPLGKVSELWT